jgi:putative nucleotidyltransferase with HDIG domain
VKGAQSIAREKKLNLLKHTGEILLEQMRHEGVDDEAYLGSTAFVQATIDTLGDDPAILALLEILNQHADFVYAHSVGVSLYGVMLAHKADWTLPANKFKVAAGGLFHDIGLKEIDRGILTRPRREWSADEVRLYESHPLRGLDLLKPIRSVPADVLRIVHEHHEDCLGHGFPRHLRRTAIHPMAKLISVANAFCELVIGGPHRQAISPRMAIAQMEASGAGRFDPAFMDALARLFKCETREKLG